MQISFNSNGSTYSGINTNSKLEKGTAKKLMDAHRAEVAMMSPEQKMLFELFGGEAAYQRNIARNFDEDGDFINSYGISGMDSTGKGISWHKLINVSEEHRQKMFDNVKREFIQENGISNGDTTKRSDVFAAYQKSVKKEDRLSGTWTLGQYEGQYRAAMYAAVKATNPNWKLGQPFDASILDHVTRASVESTLEKSGDTFVKKSSVSGNSVDISI